MMILKLFGFLVIMGVVVFAFLLIKATDSLQKEIDLEIDARVEQL